MFTASEKLLSATPPGHEWVPLLLIAALWLAALYYNRRRRL